jgi:hypothetical protein
MEIKMVKMLVMIMVIMLGSISEITMEILMDRTWGRITVMQMEEITEMITEI